MASSPSTSGPTGLVVRVGDWLHRHFLPALIGIYVLSGVAPGPGAAIREFSLPLPGGGQERVSMFLLAVLLFCAAAVIRWSQVRDLVARPSVLVAAMAAIWLGPALLVAVLGQVLPWLAGGEATAGLFVGLAMVAAMPVANSSAGWTQNAEGNVALSLGLVVLSIVLSPLATPNMLRLMGLALTPNDTERIREVVTQFSGLKFILWVILPSLVGAAYAWAAGPERIARAKPWFRIATLLTILTLNYANASLAVDKIWASESLGIVAMAAGLVLAVNLVGIVLAEVEARAFGLPRESLTALLFGLSMNHTGLALVLAGEFLKDQPRAILVILLATLSQHLVAALVDWRLQRSEAENDLRSS